MGSQLQNGITSFGGIYNFIQKLRVTQNLYLRIILKIKKREALSFPLYQELKMLPFQHWFTFKVFKVFFLRIGNRGEYNLA